MGNTAKTDNFLRAIKNYSKVQNSRIQSEIKQLKQESERVTAEKAKRDSERLIADRLEQKRSEQTALLARKTREGQGRLFAARSEMTNEIFKDAANKLAEYAKTPAYRDSLRESARRISELFGKNDCVLYCREDDADYVGGLLSLFEANAQVKPDKTIKLGGLRGWCVALRLAADETLDSKLEQQREWFVANAGLRVD